MSFALITGASKGIGKAIAQNLAKRKIDLLLVARSAELLEDLAKELKSAYQIKVFCMSIDLAPVGSAQQVMDWVSQNNFQVNILVNNAGYGLAGEFSNFSWLQHRDMISVNMMAQVQMIHCFLPLLKSQAGRSYVLNIVSTAAYQAVPKLATYGASKVFMLSFSRALQFELRKTNVSVTAVSPGATDTDFVNRAAMGPKARKNAAKFNMTPEAVAEIAVKAMLARKVETITGFTNKFAGFLAWILPKRVVEATAANIYD